MVVTRTREWVEREYDREKWPAARDAIADVVGTAAPGDLRHVVNRVAELLLSSTVTSGAARDRLFARVDEAVAHLVQRVAAAMTDQTGAVIELGSGWGRNLCEVYLRTGRADVAYVAAEYTPSGRRCTDALAEIDPGMSLTAVPFDLTAPDLAPVGRHAHAVVFTNHAIEQVPHVTDELLDAIRRVATDVTVLHFEPVGWQMHRGSGSSESYATLHDYNRNLVEVLRRAEGRQDIAIADIVVDAVGANQHNSSTYIRWSPTCAGTLHRTRHVGSSRRTARVPPPERQALLRGVSPGGTRAGHGPLVGRRPPATTTI
jgi:hypothetical protein